MGFSSSIFEGLIVGFCDVFDDTASSSSRNKIYTLNITQSRRFYNYILDSIEISFNMSSYLQMMLNLLSFVCSLAVLEA